MTDRAKSAGGVKRFVPKFVKEAVKTGLSSVLPAYRKVQCNICGWRGQKFLDWDGGYGHVYPNAECPGCESHPRHRALDIYLRKIIPTDRPLQVLHFSPEKSLRALLQSYKNIEYLSVDIDPAKAMRKEDITGLSFPDKSFDMVICLHVLEHVPADRKAMTELLRVLREDGFALIDVPIDYNRKETYEDSSITTPEARTKAFWQQDHVRLYGQDFPKKLEAAGFKVKIDRSIEALGPAKVEFHGLHKNPIFYCTK